MSDQYWSAAKQDPAAIPFRAEFDAARDPLTARNKLGAAGLESPVFTGDPQAPTPSPGDNDTSIATTEFVTDAITAAITAASPGPAIGFRAWKNSVAQTPITAATYVKLTFTTEEYDQGSYYDAANSKWTPPAGLIHIDAVVYGSAVGAGVAFWVLIFKDGVPLKFSVRIPATGAEGNQISLDDVASGTNYYEVYVFSANGGTMDGGNATYFCGHIVR